MAQDRWLVRTAENRISGPYSRDAIRKMVLDDQLAPQDEICQANGYWIFLHEKDELRKLLDIEFMRSAAVGEDDITEDDITPTDTPRPRASEANRRNVRKKHHPQVQGRIERPAVWKGVIVLLLTGFGLLLLLIFQFLRSS